jgi:hypothetical protein
MAIFDEAYLTEIENLTIDTLPDKLPDLFARFPYQEILTDDEIVSRRLNTFNALNEKTGGLISSSKSIKKYVGTSLQFVRYNVGDEYERKKMGAFILLDLKNFLDSK